MIKKLLILMFVTVVFFVAQIFSAETETITRDSDGRIISIKNKNGSMETRFNYFSNGDLKEKIEFREGEYHGKIVSWYANGKKEMEVDFKNGILNGKAIVWFKNGKVKMLSEFKNGDHHGKFIEMNEKGELSSLAIFRNGEMYSANIPLIQLKHPSLKGSIRELAKK